jgi:hypothetical protein
MFLSLNPIPISVLEENGVRLVHALSANVAMRSIVVSLGLLTEEIERDGLGIFDFFFFQDDIIGYWAFAGSQADPDYGAYVWAQPNVSEADLINAAKRMLEPTECQFINASTGKIID